jgi:predicted transcriptional regulator
VRRDKPPPRDPRGGHARLYWAILDSPAWRALTHADVRVYLALRRKLKGSNNGDINATLAEMKHAGISSSSTLASALHRLEALGFIEKTRQGGIANGGKLCSLYRFTDAETYDIARAGVTAGPATDDWRKFANIAEARAAVRIFRRKTTPKVRTLERSGSTIEAQPTKAASTIEQVAQSPVRPSKRRIRTATTPEPA